jgi:hypothetical protein
MNFADAMTLQFEYQATTAYVCVYKIHVHAY